MYSIGRGGPGPDFFMNQFVSWEVAQKENKWQGRNLSRWRNAEYDRTYRAARIELDPVKRAALYIHMNELVIGNRVVIPIVIRPELGAASNKLRMTLSGWDNHTWLLRDWYRDDL
jgi:peptide/nickel transport system substrate-binding protein